MRRLVRYLKQHHIGLLALFVALCGTAYAAGVLPKNSVGSKQIKTGAVGTLEVKDKSLLAKDFKAGQLGSTGTQGLMAPVGPDDLAPVLHARVRLRNTERTVASSTALRVIFDSVVEDTGGMASLTNHPTTLVAPRDGLYLVQAELDWHAISGKGRMGGSAIAFRTDGVTAVGLDTGLSNFSFVDGGATSLQYIIQPLSGVFRLQAGQQVALSAYQTTAEPNTLTNSDEGTFLEMTYLGR